MEKENLLLLQGVEDTQEDKVEQIEAMLEQVYTDMNNEGRSVVVCGQNSLQLSVIDLGSDPPHVFDHQVPLLSVDTEHFDPDQWDLTTTQILPFIDGFSHIKRISDLADVEPNLVRACVENLVYHRVVAMLPIFQYCNIYTVTPDLANLRSDVELQMDLLLQAARSEEQLPTFRDVYTFTCSFTYGTTVKDLCHRLNPAEMGIDERRLVQYLVKKGILRRVFKHPVWSGGDSTSVPIELQKLYACFTGEFHTDQICVATGLSAAQLDAKIEADSNILVLWK